MNINVLFTLLYIIDDKLLGKNSPPKSLSAFFLSEIRLRVGTDPTKNFPGDLIL